MHYVVLFWRTVQSEINGFRVDRLWVGGLGLGLFGMGAVTHTQNGSLETLPPENLGNLMLKLCILVHFWGAEDNIFISCIKVCIV